MAEMGCWGRGGYLALICVKKHDHALSMAGEGWTFFFLFSNSTDSLLSLHFTTANDYNDGCMHGTGLSLFNSLFSRHFTASGKRRKAGSSGLSFAFLLCRI